MNKTITVRNYIQTTNSIAILLAPRVPIEQIVISNTVSREKIPIVLQSFWICKMG